MFRYYELLTDVPLSEISRWKQQIAEGEINPRDIKARLARLIVADFWGEEAARRAEEEFVRIFRKKEAPTEMEEIPVAASSLPLIDLLVDRGLLPSRGEAKRLIRQGGVYLDGQRINDITYTLALKKKQSVILRLGKRKFFLLKRNEN